MFFQKNSRKFATSPLQHSAAIGCTKNCQPIEVTVHSHRVESFESDVGEGGVAMNCEKNTIFPEHPVCNIG